MACEKNIYCPKCGRKVAKYDGRSSINIVVKCQNCKKMVVYDVEKDETICKDIPLRSTSSGKRYY